MEREIDKKNLVLKEDESIGTVQIADDVVAMIASLSTMGMTVECRPGTMYADWK